MSAKTAGLLFCLLLGGLAAVAIYWQLTHVTQSFVSSKAAKRPPELPTVTPTPPFQLPPLEQFSEIVVRPVFVAARRSEPPLPPQEEAPPPPVATVPDQKFTLLGVVMTPNVSTALIRPEAPNAKTARVQVGQTVSEWRLEAVFPNRVVIRKEQATQDLALVRPKKATGPRTKRNGSKPALDMPGSPPAETPQTATPDGLPPSVLSPAQPPQMDN